MSESEGSSSFDVRHFIRVVRRHAWLVAFATVAVVGPAVAWTNSMTPQYRAAAEMLLEPKRSETLFPQGSGGGGEPSRAIATEAKRLRSRAVTEAAVRKLGYRADIRTEASGLDNVIKVSAVSSDPKRAADVANTFIVAYIQHRRSTALADLLDAQTEIQKKIDEKQRAIDGLDAGVAAAPLAQQPGLREARSFERSSLANQQQLFRDQVDQLQVNSSLNSGGAEMLTPAEAPGTPFEPRVGRTAGMAVVAGLMLGVGLAFAMNLLDDTIKSDDDLQRAGFGLPVLGSIPLVRGWKKDKTAELVSISEPMSPAAEGYRGLRASVQFLGVDRPLRVVQVTSPAVSEGKSTTSSNLAVALARAGRRVVVVCCDLRRPRLHHFFELSNEIGLTSVLVGDVALGDALQRVSGEDFELHLLASGPLPPNPSELLSGQHFTDMLADLTARADIVVIDSPPVLAVSDAAVLTTNADAAVVVIRPGRTSRRDLKRALASLRQVNAHVAGIVLNGVGRGGLYSYSHYGEEQSRPAPTPERRVNGSEPALNGRPPVEVGGPGSKAEQKGA